MNFIKKIYAVVRVSTPSQKPERQIENIKKHYPDAIFIIDTWTGSNEDGRKEWKKYYPIIKKEAASGIDIEIVWDEASRLMRNEIEGTKLYEEIFNLGITMHFIKQPHLDSDVYRMALQNANIPKTGTYIDLVLDGVRNFLMELAKEQVRLAFRQSEEELKLLHARTSEGMKVAKANGKQIGRIHGKKYETKKSKNAKEIIIKCNKSFNGNNTDQETAKIAGISINTLYKYKREIRKEKQR